VPVNLNYLAAVSPKRIGRIAQQSLVLKHCTGSRNLRVQAPDNFQVLSVAYLGLVQGVQVVQPLRSVQIVELTQSVPAVPIVPT